MDGPRHGYAALEFLLTIEGEGIANMFMRPYNFKVWAIPAVNMQCEWLGERAATIDVKQAVRTVLRGRKAPAPKAFFRFPQVRFLASHHQLINQERRYRSYVACRCEPSSKRLRSLREQGWKHIIFLINAFAQLKLNL